MKTFTKTYSIEKEIFNKFDLVCSNRKLNKSKVIQECIKNFIIDDFDFEGKTFFLKIDDDNYNPITILKKENDKLHLSDGNILNYFLFEKIYIEEDPYVKKTLEVINVYNSGKIFKDVLEKAIEPNDYTSNIIKEAEKLNDKKEEEIEVKTETVNPDFLNHCNIDPEAVKTFVNNIDLEKIDLGKIDEYELPKVKFNYEKTDDQIKTINDKLKDLTDTNMNMINATKIFNLENLEIYVFEYNLIIYYNRRMTSFNKIELIRLLNILIKDTSIVNIKMVPYYGQRHDDNGETFIPIVEDENMHIGNLEKYINRKFNVEKTSIIKLFNNYSINKEDIGKISYLIKVDALILRKQAFLDIINHYFADYKVSFDLEKYESVQGLPYDYDEKMKKIEIDYIDTVDERKKESLIDKLNNEYGVEVSTFI